MRRDIDNPNAWSSSETWAIRKWMVGEREIMEAWREETNGLLEDEILAKDRWLLRRTLAAKLRREAETYCCSFAGGLATELMEAGLANVNWNQIAEATLVDFAKAGMAIPQEDELKDKQSNATVNPFTEDFRENPFTFEQDHPAEGYPLTIVELKVIGRHWWEKYIDTGVFCRLYGTTGSSDLRCWDYASCRIRRMETIIGDQESQKLYAEACLGFKRMLGDAVWQAYVDGKPILGDDATEEEKAHYEREMAKAGWVSETKAGSA